MPTLGSRAGQKDSSGSFQLWDSRIPWAETLGFPQASALLSAVRVEDRASLASWGGADEQIGIL